MIEYMSIYGHMKIYIYYFRTVKYINELWRIIQ